ncbi:MAG: PaaI family thioesterase [Desulfobacterales bacterium]|nr:PaaI family thioesterase [Desulfobacterales bacterium]
MIDTASLKLLPNMQDHNCFGCSPVNPHGLKMTFLAADEAVISRLSVPDHLCGWNHLVHGGVVSTILDEIMGRSAVYLLGRVILTRSMQVDFLKPVFTGKPIQAEGRVLERVSEREAKIEGRLYDTDGVLCARSTGTFALFTPETIRKLKFMDDALVDGLEQLIEADGAGSVK